MTMWNYGIDTIPAFPVGGDTRIGCRTYGCLENPTSKLTMKWLLTVFQCSQSTTIIRIGDRKGYNNYGKARECQVDRSVEIIKHSPYTHWFQIPFRRPEDNSTMAAYLRRKIIANMDEI